MANSLIILHQIYLLMSKQGFPMTPLILGLSCEHDLTLHQISYPLNIFLLLFAWLVENCSLFPSLISWQIEKKRELPRNAISVFPYTSVCECTSVYVCVCPQGSSRSVSRVKSVCLLWPTVHSFYLTSHLRCDCPVKALIESNLKRTNTARVAYRTPKLCDQLKKQRYLLSH